MLIYLDTIDDNEIYCLVTATCLFNNASASPPVLTNRRAMTTDRVITPNYYTLTSLTCLSSRYCQPPIDFLPCLLSTVCLPSLARPFLISLIILGTSCL